jgi:hypothetical protein
MMALKSTEIFLGPRAVVRVRTQKGPAGLHACLWHVGAAPVGPRWASRPRNQTGFRRAVSFFFNRAPLCPTKHWLLSLCLVNCGMEPLKDRLDSPLLCRAALAVQNEMAHDPGCVTTARSHPHTLLALSWCQVQERSRALPPGRLRAALFINE